MFSVKDNSTLTETTNEKFKESLLISWNETSKIMYIITEMYRFITENVRLSHYWNIDINVVSLLKCKNIQEYWLRKW